MSRRRQPSRRGMTKVLTHMCMSLDGFVAQADDNPAELFDWYWSGDVVVQSAQESMSFSVDAASAPMLQDLASGCGALIAGRRLFDLTDGWGDNHPAGAPVVVVTHRPPPEDAAATFHRTSCTGRGGRLCRLGQRATTHYRHADLQFLHWQKRGGHARTCARGAWLPRIRHPGHGPLARVRRARKGGGDTAARAHAHRRPPGHATRH